MSCLLSASNISLVYKSKQSVLRSFKHQALSRVSLTISTGETLGIVGRNGCGKSSLLKILAGIIKPTSGSLTFPPDARRALLTLGLGFRADLSGADNVLISMMLQGMSKTTARELLPAIQEYSEISDFFSRPIKSYSSGMKARLGFATALTAEVDLLLIDEVLSVGDAHFKKKAEASIREKMSGLQTVVLVSHAMNQVRSLCDQVIWIDGGSLVDQGDPDHVTEKYEQFIEDLT